MRDLPAQGACRRAGHDDRVETQRLGLQADDNLRCRTGHDRDRRLARAVAQPLGADPARSRRRLGDSEPPALVRHGPDVLPLHVDLDVGDRRTGRFVDYLAHDRAERLGAQWAREQYAENEAAERDGGGPGHGASLG